jgi:hypothetical protein
LKQKKRQLKRIKTIEDEKETILHEKNKSEDEK